MIFAQSIRVVAFIGLLIGSLCIVGRTNDFCIAGYFSNDTFTRLADLNGAITKDPDMLAGCGLTALLFMLPLMLSYRRACYGFFFVVLILIQLILLTVMIDSPSTIELIYDSIKYCQNYGLLAWVIGELLFIILSLVFIFYEFEN